MVFVVTLKVKPHKFIADSMTEKNIYTETACGFIRCICFFTDNCFFSFCYIATETFCGLNRLHLESRCYIKTGFLSDLWWHHSCSLKEKKN